MRKRKWTSNLNCLESRAEENSSCKFIKGSKPCPKRGRMLGIIFVMMRRLEWVRYLVSERTMFYHYFTYNTKKKITKKKMKKIQKKRKEKKKNEKKWKKWRIKEWESCFKVKWFSDKLGVFDLCLILDSQKYAKRDSCKHLFCSRVLFISFLFSL